jgi:predicted dehydrogenase
MSRHNRRSFLQETSVGLATATTLSLARSTTRAMGANEQIRVGIIGTGGMGSNHTRTLAGRDDVQITRVCDADANRMRAAAQVVEDRCGQAPTASGDLREVLDDKNVDAVFIATPDHWHAPATILACDAGKHVYVEKPCSHNIREGRLMVEAARRNNRLVQVGTQSRSTEHVIQAMKALRAGIIGDVLVAKAWNSQRRGNIGHQEPSDPPPHLDFDAWLGPAPERPYQANMLHGIWRWWFDFGVGDIGNDGVHDIDIARWGLGVERHPDTIAALGGKYFFDDDQQWPDTQYVVYEYAPEKQGGQTRQLIFEQRIWSPYVQQGHENGNAFYGTKGVMILGKKDGWTVTFERNQAGPSMTGSFSLPSHHDDFFDCLRTGKQPNADILIGHHSASLCHLGNIATLCRRTINFDPRREEIVDDPQAAQRVRRQYREGHWAVPQGV